MGIQLELVRSRLCVKLFGTRVVLYFYVPANGLSFGPIIVTSKYLIFSSCASAVIPGGGSAMSLSVS